MDIKTLFSEYYKKASLYVKEIQKREFAIGYKEKIEKRHLSFFSEEELKHFLVTQVPFYISHSNAYYKRPSAEMKEKGFIKADLAFDIDVDSTINGISKAKEETIKIVDMLKEDIGANDIHINFSGNRGFHVYVRDDNIATLNSEERKKILEYITGKGFDYTLLFEKIDNKLIGPKITDKGFRGRFAKEAITMLQNNEKFSKLFAKDKLSLYKFIEGIKDGIWNRTSVKNIIEKLKPVSELITIKESFIDGPVTYDLTKLMRLTNSLHGSTGFRVLPIKNIEKFEIDKAYAFSDEPVKVKIIENTGKHELVGIENLKKDQVLNLPLYAAVYLECKNLGVMIKN
jgi:DNA primase small subunit